MDGLEKLTELIRNSHRIVFFGGAGVSTESGIPDFRSTDGLYHQKYDYPPERIISRSFFNEKTEEFYRFYRDKMLYLDAKPNACHTGLAELEAGGKLLGVITQNIDGLHQMAGSKRVLELHGSVHRNFCMRCGKEYDARFVKESSGVPRCHCGGIVKPDVVLYEESLNEAVLSESVALLRGADVLIVGGTSLSVYPAAGLLRYFEGSALVLINKSKTPMDKTADLVINDSIAQVFSKILARL